MRGTARAGAQAHGSAMNEQTLSAARTGLDVASLVTGFRGQVLTAEHGELYDGARMAFNAMFDRRPAVIARATCTADLSM